VEHVFPQWMQAVFDLAELKVTLSDGSQRKYSELFMPSCARCNNEFLSRFENRIENTRGRISAILSVAQS